MRVIPGFHFILCRISHTYVIYNEKKCDFVELLYTVSFRYPLSVFYGEVAQGPIADCIFLYNNELTRCNFMHNF